MALGDSCSGTRGVAEPMGNPRRLELWLLRERVELLKLSRTSVSTVETEGGRNKVGGFRVEHNMLQTQGTTALRRIHITNLIESLFVVRHHEPDHPSRHLPNPIHDPDLDLLEPDPEFPKRQGKRQSDPATRAMSPPYRRSAPNEPELGLRLGPTRPGRPTRCR